MASYLAELAERIPGGFDPSRSSVDSGELAPPLGAFLVARAGDGAPLGCGGVRLLPGRIAEIKRMWVSPAARGRGVGRALLGALEAEAARLGAGEVRLDTNAALTEAVALYRSSGYRPVEAYNENPYAELWFAKRLR